MSSFDLSLMDTTSSYRNGRLVEFLVLILAFDFPLSIADIESSYFLDCLEGALSNHNSIHVLKSIKLGVALYSDILRALAYFPSLDSIAIKKCYEDGNCFNITFTAKNGVVLNSKSLARLKRFEIGRFMLARTKDILFPFSEMTALEDVSVGPLPNGLAVDDPFSLDLKQALAHSWKNMRRLCLDAYLPLKEVESCQEVTSLFFILFRSIFLFNPAFVLLDEALGV